MDAAYCARVPERLRHVPAPNLEAVAGAEEWRKLLRAWDQTLRRYAADDLRFPVELEEAWVAALEDPWRSDCIRELAERYGLYGAFRRPATVAGDTASWASVLEDFGLVTRDMAAVLADGRIDQDDASRLPALLRDVQRMQADLESLRQHVQAAAEGGGGRDGRGRPGDLAGVSDERAGFAARVA
ncbi:hypothetical protein LMH63_12750 [Spiribacter halobius]|uniref:hypothetical protein n=1 Tax=Sediminicurvatus halobius TaxID=2182432 RepID=UPI001E4B24E6|nr:hypothetical protein [Spiribacter halobius]UEX76824.1 hypothetical protein LMH63_12750 [Spiribacter halobius]